MLGLPQAPPLARLPSAGASTVQALLTTLNLARSPERHTGYHLRDVHRPCLLSLSKMVPTPLPTLAPSFLWVSACSTHSPSLKPGSPSRVLLFSTSTSRQSSGPVPRSFSSLSPDCPSAQALPPPSIPGRFPSSHMAAARGTVLEHRLGVSAPRPAAPEAEVGMGWGGAGYEPGF